MEEDQKRALFVFNALEGLRELVKSRGMTQPEFQRAIFAYSMNLAHELGCTEPEFVADCESAAQEEWRTPSEAEQRGERRRPEVDTTGAEPVGVPTNRARLDTEQRCREMADRLKAELPEDQGFILIVFNYESSRFQNLSYVATLKRPDAARLLNELTDNWLARDQIAAEPSAHTATILRELVAQMGPADLRGVTQHQGRVQAKGRRAEGLAAHLEAAAQHLACYQRDQHQVHSAIRKETEN